MLGIVVALAVSTLVFPDRARLRLRDGLAQEFLVLGAFFEAILQGFRGNPLQNLATLREDALAALRGNNQLLEAARNEPSGGPGWREGLSMLAQFGRSIFDALVALEFAVKDSHEDAYAQQFEPALDGWPWIFTPAFTTWRPAFTTGDFTFRRRLSTLKKISRNWRLAWTRCGIRASQFSQAEILRAYAVQLHLKQIARLLRASRVETSSAIGEAQK